MTKIKSVNSNTSILIGEGSNYIIPDVTTDNPTTNGTNLVNAYAAAVALNSANGLSLSSTNRFTILLMPSMYQLATNALNLNTQYIDIVGISDNAESTILTSTGNTVLQNADNVWIKNCYITTTSISGDFAYTIPASTSYNNQLMENVIFYQTSDNGKFMQAGSTYEYSGIYKKIKANVTGGNARLFGGGSTASGTFIDCDSYNTGTGNNASFGGGTSGVASGTFTNCMAYTNTGNISAFSGGTGGVASGIFINCKTHILNSSPNNNFSFGGGDAGIASGTFTGCTVYFDGSGTGGLFAFGGYTAGGSATGIFNDCTTTMVGTSTNANRSFASIASGTFTKCTVNSSYTTYSFGNDTASGTFTNCITNSTQNSGSFGYVTASGTFNNCIVTSTAGANNSFGAANAGVASGTFTNCISISNSEDESFGSSNNDNGTCSGTFFNIKKTGRLNTIFTGTLRDSEITALGTNYDGITNIRTSARIFNCTIKSNGTGKSLNSSLAGQTPAIAYSRFNSAYGANVTDGLSTNYNIIDALI